jgi:threonine/homoserine/homoserine lactone efflux protein
MPKWMAGVDSLMPGKAFGLGLLLDGLNPKNLLLTIGAATGLAELGLSGTDVVASLIVFVILGSISIAAPVIYYLAGGDTAKARLDSMKRWLAIHSAAVMTVVLLIVGVDLIAKGIPPVTS